VDVTPTTGKPSRLRQPSSPRVVAGHELGTTLALRLPANLRRRFTSATPFAEGDDPVRWARRTSGLFKLIEDPGHVLAALDTADLRHV